ncbi:zinc finger, CCHC-type containing LTR copia-type gag-polypeptide [Tanacetum coccineum]
MHFMTRNRMCLVPHLGHRLTMATKFRALLLYAEVLGLTTAHAIWTALETAYSNSSVERIHSLRDSLRNLSKGTSTVSDYGRQFKGICDKLAAIGQPVDEMDKSLHCHSHDQTLYNFS